ncbi:B12-binding domain-containing radical SAM protein [Desulfobotulus sp. H1]|uniref:B12-binding domain-containing radical SAM protein n=1 Tax=Desulfobotulus pelophilus TaxID=2823377 RepID=A0ABT3N9T1_9BACT|nr:radical SAM protein [Desulfobotulus pelophilus]MCW7754220.1 B12-binding domain-containing radical SAM protein [Desulfobotulus pelophilus]
MRIILIAPPYPLQQAPSPPLGLCYVAAACLAQKAEVKILDFIVSPWSPEILRKEFEDFPPDVIGITAVTMTAPEALEIIRVARKIRPHTLCFMGGPHATFDAENLLNDTPELDLIVLGEGEATLAELVPRLQDPECWQDIAGLALRGKDGVVFTPERPLIQDLDTLPLPSRHLLPISRYQALGFPVSIITSRGCPNGCIFCLGRRMVGAKVRHRSADLVVNEIEGLLAMGFSYINIADDLFTANARRVEVFCEEIRKRGLIFSWSVFSRVNTINAHLLRLMKEAGCVSVSFGIESGCPDMLKRVKKGITLDQAREAVAACRETGMRAHASFMVGLPGETEESLRRTQEFQDELGIESGYHFLCPFPGTTVRENIKEYDMEILTSDWRLYDADSPVVRTEGVSPERMTAFVEDCYAPLHAEWKVIQERVAAGEGTEEEKLRVLGNRRMELIFAILSKDLLEEAGISSEEDPLAFLSRTISRLTGEEEGFCTFIMEDLVRKHLIVLAENRWIWADIPAVRGMQEDSGLKRSA